MEEKDFQVEKVGTCVIVTMNLGENRVNGNFVRAMHKALDTAESYEDATCMVTTGVGKWYSLGLDLEWMFGLDGLELMQFAQNNQKLLARLLTFPLMTVAALNGHTYAAGAFCAITHDYMIMRSEKGWFCLPEVKIKRNFPVGYLNLIKARIPHAEQHQVAILGNRYTGEEAFAAKIVNEVCPVEELRERAIQAGNRLAGKDGMDRKVLGGIKYDFYRDTYRSLIDPIQLYSAL